MIPFILYHIKWIDIQNHMGSPLNYMRFGYQAGVKIHYNEIMLVF